VAAEKEYPGEDVRRRKWPDPVPTAQPTTPLSDYSIIRCANAGCWGIFSSSGWYSLGEVWRSDEMGKTCGRSVTMGSIFGRLTLCNDSGQVVHTPI